MRHKVYFILVLWLLALGIAVFLLSSHQTEQNIKLEVPAMSSTKQDQLASHAQRVSATSTLLEPRFTGRSIDGRQWDIRAQEASRSGSLSEDHVVLIDVTATVNTSTVTPLLFTANRGDYRAVEDTLQLTGNVQVEGYNLILNTPRLTAQLHNRHLLAEPYVALKGRWGGWHGTITAPRLTMTHPGPLLRLTNGVKGHFEVAPLPQTQSKEENNLE